MLTRSLQRSPQSLQAEKLILLSDVNGIYLDEKDKETKISRLTITDARNLIDTGRATGWHDPETRKPYITFTARSRSAHVISGTKRNALLSEVFTDEGTGTMVMQA
jgi:acetylglutamate kinase